MIKISKIPQKGRIRFVLVLMLVFFGIRYISPRCSNFFDGRQERRVERVDKVARVKTARQEFSFDDARKLVAENAININAPHYEIVTGKGRNLDTLTLSLSIDTMLQKRAQILFARYKPRYAALAAIDPATGRVLALASYTNPDEDSIANDLYARSVFPAASVFKIVVAAAGIERANMSAKTTIPHFGRNHTLYMSQIAEELKVSRDISLIDAFAYSINPVFARIALFNTNKDVVFDMGKRFGFNEEIPFELKVDTSEMYYPDSAFSVAEFASGFNRSTTISPIAGALIAGAISQGGKIFIPTIIDSIHSSKRDTVIYKRSSQVWNRAIKERTAVEMRKLMSAATRYGTARRSFRTMYNTRRFEGYEFGGKTGNVNKLGLGRVDWFVGYMRDPNNPSNQIAVGVVTTHGEYWTVQSSHIATEIFRQRQR